MKASELRIDNLLNCLDEDGNVIATAKVVGYLDRSIMLEVIIGESIEHYDDIVGVSLTEEWLLKVGFKHIYDDWYYNSIMSINISKKIINIDNFCVSNIEFVHQLQNLYFALTGEELTFNI